MSKLIYALWGGFSVAGGLAIGVAFQPTQIVVTIQKSDKNSLNGTARAGYGTGLTSTFECAMQPTGEARFDIKVASLFYGDRADYTVYAPDCGAALENVFGIPNWLGLSRRPSEETLTASHNTPYQVVRRETCITHSGVHIQANDFRNRSGNMYVSAGGDSVQIDNFPVQGNSYVLRARILCESDLSQKDITVRERIPTVVINYFTKQNSDKAGVYVSSGEELNGTQRVEASRPGTTDAAFTAAAGDVERRANIRPGRMREVIQRVLGLGRLVPNQ